MGLAAVLGMVRNHNGAIRAESTPGKGACFTVLFPLPSKPV
jgi:signal transduction histidine kinase